jgi:hypothetical protein
MRLWPDCARLLKLTYDEVKMASYFWSIEPDRLVLDFGAEPEEQENSAGTLGSAERKLD